MVEISVPGGGMCCLMRGGGLLNTPQECTRNLVQIDIEHSIIEVKYFDEGNTALEVCGRVNIFTTTTRQA